MRPEDFIAAISFIGLAGACLYMVRQSAKQVPNDYAEPFGEMPSPIEDDGWITVTPIINGRN